MQRTIYRGALRMHDAPKGVGVVHTCLDPETGETLAVHPDGWLTIAEGGRVYGPPVYARVRRPEVGGEWEGRVESLTAQWVQVRTEDGAAHIFARLAEGPHRTEVELWT